MPYFGRGGVTDATHIVEISGGYHVTVGLLTGKQAAECSSILNSGQRQKTTVVAKATPGRPQQEAEQTMEMTVDMVAYRDARLFRGIKSWDLDEVVLDKNGEPVLGPDGEPETRTAPVDMAHIQGLTEIDRNKIFVELEEFNAPLTEDERRK